MKFSKEKIIGYCFFAVLVFALAYVTGCSTLPVTQSFCDDAAEISASVVKAVCLSMADDMKATSAFIKFNGPAIPCPPCCGIDSKCTGAKGSLSIKHASGFYDTVEYSYAVNKNGDIDIEWFSQRGLAGRYLLTMPNYQKA